MKIKVYLMVSISFAFLIIFVFCLAKPFKNNTPVQKEEVLIVLSPHFDDAVLSVGGILSEFKGPKYIITFFGTPMLSKSYLTKWDRISGFKASMDARTQRVRENNLAAKIVGAEVINEHYLDFQYDKRTATSSVVMVSNMAKDIDRIIGSEGNARVIIIGPSYFGTKYTHPDHLLLSKALAQVIENKNHPNATFYFYEDLPYTYGRFKGNDIELEQVLTNFYPALVFEKKEILISQKSFDLKMEGIRLYTSQVRAFNSLRENIVAEITKFETKRCFPDICEVIYEAK